MNIFGVGIYGEETGKIREVVRILKAMKEKSQFVPIVVIENVLNILSAEAMKYLIEAFSELEYDYLAWRTVDLLGALPHSRNRVILVATRDGINPHDILFEANPECECEKVRTGEEKIGNEY
jgi:site-specific DNA-cytosine methylase